MQSSLQISERLNSAILLTRSLAEVWEKGDFVSLADIAERYKCSQGYLEEIAGSLRQARLIVGRRGIQGGYKLTRSPETITYADVLRAVEGEAALLTCETCALHKHSTIDPVWDDLHTRIADFFARKTIMPKSTRSKTSLQ